MTQGKNRVGADQAPSLYSILLTCAGSGSDVRETVVLRSSGKKLRVLRAGDSYQVPNQSGLTLLTGNAGGLEIEVDGTVLGALGPVGTVRRNVALEPAGLLDGSTLEQ